MTVHSGHEQTIWEGESHNVTATATGGRFTLHYRLTTHYLYFERGGITGTTNEQIPLINIQDVDISQSLIQKSRKVGNVMVRVARPGGMPETATLDSITDPHQVRDLINHTVHQVRQMAHQRQYSEQRDLGVHRIQHLETPPGAPPAPFPPGPPVQSANVIPPAPAPPLPTTERPELPAAQSPEQTMALLRQLGELRDAGVVTPEEFEAKKKELLDRL